MRCRSSVPHGLVLGLGLVFSAGCTREQKAAPAAVEPPPAAPVVHEHVPLARIGASDGSAVVLAKLEGRTVAYVADEDDNAVRAVDLESREELARTPIAGRPGQMLVGKDGRLYVALRDDQAVIALAATKDARAPLDDAGRTETAVEPIGLALTPDEETLVVVSGWGHALETFAMPSLERKAAVDLGREPRAVTVSSDGKTAFVAHASTGHMSTVPLDGARTASRIGLGTPRFTTRRGEGASLPMLLFKLEAEPPPAEPRHFVCGTAMLARMRVTIPERFGRQGYALAKYKDDKAELILAPQMTMSTGDAFVTSNGYGGGGIDEELSIATEEFEIATVDARTKNRTVKTNGLPPRARSGKDACRLPRAAVADASRRSLFVSCLGVDKVIEYDTTGASAKNTFEVPGGPVGVASDEGGKHLVVWSAFDRVVSVLTLPEPVKDGKDAKGAKAKTAAKNAEPAKVELTKIPLSPPASPLAAEVALGRSLFHKASEPKISKDGRACASCHPDGREDGLVWSTPEGPRQTIMLAGRVSRDAPFGWLGKHASIKEHVTITMRNLKGTGVSDQEFDALASYLRTMKPPPRAKTSSLSAQAEHGRDLFNSSALACASCHAEKGGFSDHEVHDVGSATGSDTARQFLVPSLRFVAGSAPYFHDGRYASLEDLLAKNQRMGDTKSLSVEDRDALAAYLRTL